MEAHGASRGSVSADEKSPGRSCQMADRAGIGEWTTSPQIAPIFDLRRAAGYNEPSSVSICKSESGEHLREGFMNPAIRESAGRADAAIRGAWFVVCAWMIVTACGAAIVRAQPPQGAIAGWGSQVVGVDLSGGFVALAAGGKTARDRSGVGVDALR